VTPELERSAFRDARARSLLERARAARLAQDSALLAYDAKTYQRLSVGLGIRRLGRDRLLMRTEHAARVRWGRGSGIWVEPTGRRAVFPMVKEAEGEADLTEATPIPYFPGARVAVDPVQPDGGRPGRGERERHAPPARHRAEAYYRYATGDSVSIRLPDGRTIALRELRITARRPEWRAFVGSFWFDVDRGSLVRAAYRMAADMDIWEVAGEDARREFDQAVTRAGGEARRAYEEALKMARTRADTARAREQMDRAVALARRAAGAERDDDDVPALVKGLITPMRANLSAITVEYGLYEGRFWLPKVNVAEGEAQAGFLRVPVRFEESFRYNSVNGADRVPRVPSPTELGLAAGDTLGGGDISIVIGDNDRTRARRADTSARGAPDARGLAGAALRAPRRQPARARRGGARQGGHRGGAAPHLARRPQHRARPAHRPPPRGVRARQHLLRRHAVPLRRRRPHGHPAAVRHVAPRPLAGPPGVDLRARRAGVRHRRARHAPRRARRLLAPAGVGAAAPGAPRRGRLAPL
jgi:hypothetical protein